MAFNGFQYETSHRLKTTTGLESSVSRRVFHHESRDVFVVDNPYKGYWVVDGQTVTCYPNTEYADTDAKYTCFTPSYSGIDIMRIDLTTTFKKTCVLAGGPGFEFSILRVPFPADSFPNYAFVDSSGSKVTGARGSDPVEQELQPRGYVALYPDFYGSCAVFALNGGLKARIESKPYAVIDVGYDMPNQTIKAGSVFKNSLLLVRDIYGATDLANFDNIRSYFGATGAPEYNPRMIAGGISSGSFCPLEMNATGSQAELTTSAAGSFSNDLPTEVSGLSGKWDAGIYDMDTHALKPIGVTDGIGYTRFSTKTARHMWVGNLLAADNEDVWVQLKDMDWRRPVVRLHNPTDAAITTRVTGLLPPLAGRTGTFTVPAGTTVEFSVP